MIKLSDITEMARVKDEYISAKTDLQRAEYAANSVGAGSIPYPGQLEINTQRMPWNVVGKAVILAAHAALKEHHDKLVSQLMLWGVEDWT